MSDVENRMIEETLTYFKKCEEFDDAIRITKENKEYLKKYVISADKVAVNFEYDKKKKIALGGSGGIALAVMGICLLAMGFSVGHLIASVIVGAVFGGAGAVASNVLLSKKLDDLVSEQDKINAGITEQIMACDKRVESIKERKKKYLEALEDRNLVVIPVKYMEIADQIIDYVNSGNAESVQDAIEQLEEQVKLIRSKQESKKRRYR